MPSPPGGARQVSAGRAAGSRWVNSVGDEAQPPVDHVSRHVRQPPFVGERVGAQPGEGRFGAEPQLLAPSCSGIAKIARAPLSTAAGANAGHRARYSGALRSGARTGPSSVNVSTHGP